MTNISDTSSPLQALNDGLDTVILTDPDDALGDVTGGTTAVLSETLRPGDDGSATGSGVLATSSAALAVLTNADDIFQTRGKLVFFAELSKAAYALHSQEPVINDVNEVSPNADAAYAGVTSLIRPLDTSDLPQLPDSGGTNAPKLVDGIFTHENAAAFVGRANDALFLAFRGTNDDAPNFPAGPDQDHWADVDFFGPDEGKKDHYDLFDELIAALDSYIAANGDIDTVYVTGHSLGASMVQAFMDDHSGTKFQAVTFASPGYGGGSGGADARIWNIWHEDDPIKSGDIAESIDGDRNVISGDLADSFLSFDAHSMDLYLGFARIISAAGIDIDDMSGAGGSLDYDRVIANARVINAELGLFEVGTGNDELFGTAADEIIIGGDGADNLRGGAGADYLDAGRGHDFVTGGTFADTLRGGAGMDELRGNGGGDDIYGQSGNDVLIGAAGADKLVGGGGDDLIKGGGGADILIGGSGDDKLVANGAADSLSGGDGRDVLLGGAGDDVLNGQAGNDILKGQAGIDTFVFEVGGDTDKIKAFEDSADVIDVSDFSLVSFNDVLALASENNGDTTFDFGAGDRIIVKGVALNIFDASDFVL